ncbi:MAG: SDR family oxidoreductase [Nannocystaceae bacterium]
MATLEGKTLFISGASRGIGKAIALRAARDGANIVIAAKTDTPHPKLPGTIHTAAEEIVAAGGQALPVVVDIRHDEMIEAAVAKAVETFGGIDILVNNASAISLTDTKATTMKRYDLMNQVNTRGTYACTKFCLPHLEKASNPHVLTLSPPLNMDPKWFRGNLAYTIAKYGMSMCVLGHAAEFAKRGIAVNALWPRTAIDTAAIRNVILGDEGAKRCRTVDIMADAAHLILTRDSKATTGNFYIDDEVLAEAGITDLDKYKVDPDAELMGDFFID